MTMNVWELSWWGWWAVAGNMEISKTFSSPHCAICLPHFMFSESALAKFSRKLSTKCSLGIQGTSLISPSDLDKSEAWKQGNPDVSVMKWSSGGPNVFPEVSIQTGDCMLVLLPVAVWSASLALKGLAQWPSASARCCFLSPSGPQGSWSKALSRYKVGFSAECQPEARQNLPTCPKPTKFLTLDSWEREWPSMSTEDLIFSIGLPEMLSPYRQLHQNDSCLPLCYLGFHFWLWTLFNDILKENIEERSFVF